ncbi:MAG: hypothetical protein V3V33_03895 [Candidatus Lokiarchaeia archaeon]
MKNITEKKNLDEGKNQNLDYYNGFKESLEIFPFIIIIGKYDHVLGPRAIYSSLKIKEEQPFIRNLLRDALNTKSKFVIIDFEFFYAQIYKIEVEDKSARGRIQLYSIILLRDIESPIIPIIHFRRIEMMFRKIGEEKILLDDHSVFQNFFKELSEIYIRKDEILPLESFNLQIRSGVNTIQGFCEIILEDKKNSKKISDEVIIGFLETILDSCNDITKTLELSLKNALK